MEIEKRYCYYDRIERNCTDKACDKWHTMISGLIHRTCGYCCSWKTVNENKETDDRMKAIEVHRLKILAKAGYCGY